MKIDIIAPLDAECEIKPITIHELSASRPLVALKDGEKDVVLLTRHQDDRYENTAFVNLFFLTGMLAGQFIAGQNFYPEKYRRALPHESITLKFSN